MVKDYRITKIDVQNGFVGEFKNNSVSNSDVDTIEFYEPCSDDVGIADELNSVDDVYIPDNGGLNKVPYMSQGENSYMGIVPVWVDVPFGDGTISSSGCSITSFAMVASYYSINNGDGYIFPDDVVQKIIDETGSRYTYHSWGKGPTQTVLFPALADMYGMNCEALGSGSVIKSLSEGKPVISHCTKGEFTKRGHFIVLSGITNDGKIVVNDPNHPSFSYKEYTIDELKKAGVNSYWQITPKK